MSPVDPVDPVDDVLGALADSTRRGILEAVTNEGPVTATQLAHRFPVSRQAIAKHLERLEDAGLVERARVGRETRWTACPDALGTARVWLDSLEEAWSRRLGALAAAARRRGERGDDG